VLADWQCINLAMSSYQPSCPACPVPLQFYPEEQYPAELGVTWDEISNCFKHQFVPKLQVCPWAIRLHILPILGVHTVGCQPVLYLLLSMRAHPAFHTLCL
jgi:hypothetical protein